MKTTGVSTEQLVHRLEKLEMEQKLRQQEEKTLPLRERELLMKRRWIRRLMRKYLAVREAIYGSRAVRLDQLPIAGNSRLWDIPWVDLIHMCIDVELAIESLAWKKKNTFAPALGTLIQQVFIETELHGENLAEVSRKLSITKREAKVMLEHSIEEMWDSLEDYDENRYVH